MRRQDRRDVLSERGRRSAIWTLSGMIVGSHGANHFLFSKLSSEQQREEIAAVVRLPVLRCWESR